MKTRPVFRLSLLALPAAALSLLGTAPDALAHTSLRRTRAANPWEAREDAGRFLPVASPWWRDLPASVAVGPQPQAAGQDGVVDDTTTNTNGYTYLGAVYTVPSGGDAWEILAVGFTQGGVAIHSSGTLTH